MLTLQNVLCLDTYQGFVSVNDTVRVNDQPDTHKKRDEEAEPEWRKKWSKQAIPRLLIDIDFFLDRAL
jgi:hypothetical protein